MSVAAMLPAPPSPYLEPGLLPGDFYTYEELLADRERETLTQLRGFLHNRITPIVNDYWERAAFPFEIVPDFARLGLLEWADPGSSKPRPSNLLAGMTALDLAHA